LELRFPQQCLYNSFFRDIIDIVELELETNIKQASNYVYDSTLKMEAISPEMLVPCQQTSPTGGVRSVGIVRLWSKIHRVFLCMAGTYEWTKLCLQPARTHQPYQRKITSVANLKTVMLKYRQNKNL
jgi:hypothetical protein